MLFDSGFILFAPHWFRIFSWCAAGRLPQAYDCRLDGWPRRGTWWNWSGRWCAYGMGTVASLATNSLVETASTGAIANIRRETPICWERNGVLAAGTLEMLATLFVVVLVVTTLYIGREIFIPIAIAIPVSFVLSPPVLVLRRWGLGRVPSVLTVVLAALVGAFLVSAVLTRQVSELVVDLPKYQATVSAKIVKLRDAAADNALFAKVSAALKNLGEINPHRFAPSSTPVPSDQPRKQLTEGQENQPPVPVEVHEPAWGPFAIVETIAGGALSSLEATFIVVIFVIFILFGSLGQSR